MTLVSFTNLIVTYNSADDVLNLLADLRAYAPASKTVLIDNASQDQTVQLVCEQYPDVQLIQNSENVGYARAVNQGFDLCTTEYVLLLNPDIRINGPDMFAAMEACLKDSRRIAVAAPLQFKFDGNKRHLNHNFSFWNLEAFKLYMASALKLKQTFRTPIRVTFLNAGCLFVRRSAFYEVGKLTEKYFLYGEEPDLFLKLKRFGFECYLLPQVEVTHYRERSLSTVPVLHRVRIRVQGILNVIDALTIGWTRILLAKLTIRRPRKMEGN